MTQQITNNDEWIASVMDWQSTALAQYLTGQRLKPAQRQYIDMLRSLYGEPPESPHDMAQRYQREDGAQ